MRLAWRVSFQGVAGQRLSRVHAATVLRLSVGPRYESSLCAVHGVQREMGTLERGKLAAARSRLLESRGLLPWQLFTLACQDSRQTRSKSPPIVAGVKKALLYGTDAFRLICGQTSVLCLYLSHLLKTSYGAQSGERQLASNDPTPINAALKEIFHFGTTQVILWSFPPSLHSMNLWHTSRNE